MRIGTGKARDDVFGLKEKEEMPGPGDYASPEPKMKQAAFISGKAGSKAKEGPGPGAYS